MRKLLTSTVGLIMGAVLLVFLGVYGYGRYVEWRAGNLTDWKAKYAARGDSIATLKKVGVRDSIVWRDKLVPVYRDARQVATADPATPPSTRAVIRACDLIVSACDSIQGNLRGQIRNLEAQKDLLEHKPAPPRIVAAGDVLYDFVGMRPVFRLGTNVKLFGPLHARVEGEYAIPSAIREGKGGGLRLLVGARINFNK